MKSCDVSNQFIVMKSYDVSDGDLYLKFIKKVVCPLSLYEVH